MMRQVVAKGFTLIEVLVVMVIIAIVTSVAVLSVGNNKTKIMARMADELSQSLSLAQEKAMLTSSTIGFEITEDHWTFLRLNGRLQPLDDPALPDYRIPADIHVNLQVMNQEESAAKAPVMISPNGDITPFVVLLSQKDQKPQWIIKGQVDGSVSVERLS